MGFFINGCVSLYSKNEYLFMPYASVKVYFASVASEKK